MKISLKLQLIATFLSCILFTLSIGVESNDGSCSSNDNGGDGSNYDETCSAISSMKETTEEEDDELTLQRYNYKFPGCRLFLAPSTIDSSNAGLGIFTTRELKRGQPIAFADIIIQVTDYIIKNGNQDEGEIGHKYIGTLIDQYSWDATKFGGHLEGKHVASLLPGIGS